ncbi:MAG: transporter substrate-binding domain-containing protein, partial [Clostridiales bacterium]
GWQMGSSADEAVTKDAVYSKLGGERKYANLGEALMDVQAGRIDAVCIDSLFFYYYAADEGILSQFKVLEDNFGKEEMAVGLRLTDQAFADKFNEAFNKVKANEGVEISNKWFGRDVLVK